MREGCPDWAACQPVPLPASHVGNVLPCIPHELAWEPSVRVTSRDSLEMVEGSTGQEKQTGRPS